MARPKTAPEIPAFTSDRMRLLAPVLTPHAINLALRRVTERGFRIARRTAERTILCEGSEIDRKCALIVTLEINPREELDGEEDAILYGESRKTIASKRARGELG